jgi:hypothetical protein
VGVPRLGSQHQLQLFSLGCLGPEQADLQETQLKLDLAEGVGGGGGLGHDLFYRKNRIFSRGPRNQVQEATEDSEGFGGWDIARGNCWGESTEVP